MFDPKILVKQSSKKILGLLVLFLEEIIHAKNTI